MSEVLSHPAVFTSYVQWVLLAAGWRTPKMCCYRCLLVFSCCCLFRQWHFR